MFNKYFVFIVVLLSFLGGCAGSQTPLDDESIKNRLVPGLRVLYFNGDYSHVWQIPTGDRALLEKGRPGLPILIIDNKFGENEVFDSGRNREVGMQMTGYLHLEQKGTYEFQALSNDGVEIIIDGNSILIDPDVHLDRLSNIETLSVKETGWHSLMVKYFQRKGTAAITLFWKTPGKDEFEVIPARVYGHLLDDPKTHSMLK